jgi:hypothetical protein
LIRGAEGRRDGIIFIGPALKASSRMLFESGLPSFAICLDVESEGLIIAGQNP